MITIEYAGYGKPVSDFDYEKVLKDIIWLCLEHSSPTPYCFSSSIIFTAIRLAIAKGEIPHDKIQFKYQDKVFSVNKYGAIMDWPTGFCDIGSRMCEEILKLAMAKRKQEKAS